MAKSVSLCVGLRNPPRMLDTDRLYIHGEGAMEEGEGPGEGAAQAAECQQRPDPGQRRGREVPWTR